MPQPTLGAGVYTVGAESRPITGAARQAIVAAYRAGQSVSQIRGPNGVRSQGFRVGNTAISGVIREIKQIDKARQSLRSVTDFAKPRKGVVQSGMKFGTEYRFFGEAVIGPDPDEDYPEDDDLSDETVTIGPIGIDHLPTMGEMKERIRAIAIQIAQAGGPRRSGGRPRVVKKVSVTGIQRSA